MGISYGNSIAYFKMVCNPKIRDREPDIQVKTD